MSTLTRRPDDTPSTDILHVLLFQVLIKPKPVFQTAVVSEQTRQLVTETLQQVTRSAEGAQGQTPNQDGSSKDEPGEVPQGSAHGTLFFPPQRSQYPPAVQKTFLNITSTWALSIPQNLHL